jgi:hypothetical protein
MNNWLLGNAEVLPTLAKFSELDSSGSSMYSFILERPACNLATGASSICTPTQAYWYGRAQSRSIGELRHYMDGISICIRFLRGISLVMKGGHSSAEMTPGVLRNPGTISFFIFHFIDSASLGQSDA